MSNIFFFYFWLPNAELYVEIPMSFVLLSNTRRQLGVDFFSNFPPISFLFVLISLENKAVGRLSAVYRFGIENGSI
jgi:hypothetical protein